MSGIIKLEKKHAFIRGGIMCRGNSRVESEKATSENAQLDNKCAGNRIRAL